MTDFFISYNQSDRDWAEWIAWELEAKSYTTRIQAWDFHGNFVLEMDKATKEAERTIAVLSPEYVQALFTPPEWAAAFAQDPTSEKGKLIPVRVRAVELKGILAQINYVDFVGQDEQTARKMLLARVAGLRLKPSNQPSFPGAPLPRKPVFPASPTAQPAVWQLPHARNPNFTGRKELLEALHQKLSSNETPALVQAIYGLGGVGKTQTAVEYAYQHRNAYSVVWWIRAEEPALLADDYGALARALDLKEQDAAEQAIVTEAVRKWLEQNTGWLLIFDNAQSSRELADYVPRGRAGNIIITSRNPAWGAIASPLKVDVMTEAEAVRFLRPGGADEAATKALAHELGYLPLALELARAYIEENAARAFQLFLGYLKSIKIRYWHILQIASPTRFHSPQPGKYQSMLQERGSSASSELMSAMRIFRLRSNSAPIDYRRRRAPSHALGSEMG